MLPCNTDYSIGAVKENANDLNFSQNHWEPAMFLKLMETMTMMSNEEFDSFLQFCKTWTRGDSNWPADYVMQLAKKELEDFEKILPEQRQADSHLQTVEKDWSLVDHGQPAVGQQDQNLMEAPERVADINSSLRGPIVSDIPFVDEREPSTDEKLVHSEPVKEEINMKTEPESLVEEPETRREENTLHIVLVGESGNGKTTMINSFANIFKYRTFEDALDNGPRVCIPTRFTTFVGMEGTRHTIIRPALTDSTGPENNENLNGNCASVTKDPTTHTFKYKSGDGTVVTVNLTDTPGMNDTDGDAQDVKNIAKISAHLESLPFIDAICLVLKPNEARLSLNLRSMLKKLLDNLPKERYGNIVICFSYGTKPGESLVMLRKNYTELNMEAENIFCYDNEFYRYLCLLNQHPDEEDDRRTVMCNESFEHNEKELKRMLTRIESLKPFKIKPSKALPTTESYQPSNSSSIKPALAASSIDSSAGSSRTIATSPHTATSYQAMITSNSNNSTITPAPATSTVGYKELTMLIKGNEEERNPVDPHLSHEKRVEGILENLIEHLAIAIVWGMIKKIDLNWNVQDYEVAAKTAKDKIPLIYYYCKYCNSSPCRYHHSDLNICKCTHHVDVHQCLYEGNVHTVYEGIDKENEYRDQIRQYNRVIETIRKELDKMDKEQEIIVYACLVFSFFLSPLPRVSVLSRKFPYYDLLHDSLHSIYESHKKKTEERDKTLSLRVDLSNFDKNFLACIEKWNKNSYRPTVTNVEQALKSLTHLEIRKELSNAVTAVLSTYR